MEKRSQDSKEISHSRQDEIGISKEYHRPRMKD